MLNWWKMLPLETNTKGFNKGDDWMFTGIRVLSLKGYQVVDLVITVINKSVKILTVEMLKIADRRRRKPG